MHKNTSLFGLHLNAKEFRSLSTLELKEKMMNHGYVAVDDIDMDVEEFRMMYSQYGSRVEYSEDKIGVGFGYVDTLPLHGEPNKVVTGRGQLPLHADGGLLQSEVDHVFLYSTDIQNIKFRGSTIIVDHIRANEEMPIHLKRVIDNERFQVQVLERGYYSNVSPDGWFDVPVFTPTTNGHRMLLYFPFAEGQPRSWMPRIVGFSDYETEQFFDELEKYYKQYKYCYTHHWKNNQLLIMDNRRVLHEREEFNDDSIIRKLYRGQTQES